MQPLPICGILEAMGILGDIPCPSALQNYSLMIPFGHGVGMGDQDVCTSVTEVPTHFCHNALWLPGFPFAKSNEGQSHSWHTLQALDGEHITRIRQQPINPFPKKAEQQPNIDSSSWPSSIPVREHPTKESSYPKDNQGDNWRPFKNHPDGLPWL